MVKDIFDSFIQNADSINFMVLLPQAFNFMNGNDVSFETASSSRIRTIKLFYKHKIASQTIGLLIAHDDTDGNEILCHNMLKRGLKMDQVHTFKDLSMS